MRRFVEDDKTIVELEPGETVAATDGVTYRSSVVKEVPGDLDKKLEEILDEPGGSLAGANGQKVKQIKQVFKDAGYIRTVDVSMPAVTPYIPEPRMTGQEWYERFVKELEKLPTLGEHEQNVDYEDTIEAAKRASGVRDE